MRIVVVVVTQIALVQNNRPQIHILVAIDPHLYELVKNFLERFNLTNHRLRGDFRFGLVAGGVEKFICEKQLRKVDWQHVFGNAHDKEFTPRLLEQQQLISERKLCKGCEILEEVDVHEQ